MGFRVKVVGVEKLGSYELDSYGLDSYELAVWIEPVDEEAFVVE